jgi:tetratricopeptide (TPR) repeat protein
MEEACNAYAEAVFIMQIFKLGWPKPERSRIGHDIGVVLMCYGSSLFALQQYDRAIPVFMDATQYYEAERENAELGVARNFYAVCQHRLQDHIVALYTHVEAIATLRSSLEEPKKGDALASMDQEILAIALQDYGHTLEALGRLDEACQAYAEALHIFYHLPRSYYNQEAALGLVWSLILLGGCLIQANYPSDAEIAYRHSLSLTLYPSFKELLSKKMETYGKAFRACINALDALHTGLVAEREGRAAVEVLEEENREEITPEGSFKFPWILDFAKRWIRIPQEAEFRVEEGRRKSEIGATSVTAIGGDSQCM